LHKVLLAPQSPKGEVFQIMKLNTSKHAIHFDKLSASLGMHGGICFIVTQSVRRLRGTSFGVKNYKVLLAIDTLSLLGIK